MRGNIFAVKGNHLISFAFENNDELTKLLALFDRADNALEPYFSAKATRNADVVINGLANVLSDPKLQTQSTEPPICPKHGQPMKASNHGGWYCPKKDMGDYCKISVGEDGTWKGLQRDAPPRRRR